MTNRRLYITLYATEEVNHQMRIAISVPHDCDDDHIRCLTADYIAGLRDNCEWECVDSDGMSLSDDIEIDEAKADEQPDLYFRWGPNGLEADDPDVESA